MNRDIKQCKLHASLLLKSTCLYIVSIHYLNYLLTTYTLFTKIHYVYTRYIQLKFWVYTAPTYSVHVRYLYPVAMLLLCCCHVVARCIYCTQPLSCFTPSCFGAINVIHPSHPCYANCTIIIHNHTSKDTMSCH